MEPYLRLRVSTRRVLGGAGGQQSVNDVFCLTRGRTVDVTECDACGAHAGDLVDLASHRNYVLCKKPPLEAARALEPVPRTLVRRRDAAPPSPAERTPLGDIMTCDVFCAREDLDRAALVAIFGERRVGAVPVLDDAGRPVGMVTRADLLARPPTAHRAGDLMRRLVFTLPETASIAEAAALMALEHVHHLAIVAADGVLVGLLSSHDVLAWLARTDGYVLPR